MIVNNEGIYLGKGEAPATLLLKYANRHGLIAGATGTGKTLSLQGLAEGFSSASGSAGRQLMRGLMGALLK